MAEIVLTRIGGIAIINAIRNAFIGLFIGIIVKGNGGSDTVGFIIAVMVTGLLIYDLILINTAKLTLRGSEALFTDFLKTQRSEDITSIEFTEFGIFNKVIIKGKGNSVMIVKSINEVEKLKGYIDTFYNIKGKKEVLSAPVQDDKILKETAKHLLEIDSELEALAFLSQHKEEFSNNFNSSLEQVNILFQKGKNEAGKKLLASILSI